MNRLDTIRTDIAPHGLCLMGHLQEAGDSLILIGATPRFWEVFQKSPEYRDGAADPVDRWSKRILVQIARARQGHAVFPSDGPPYAPFIAWALRSGRFWQSPTGMMIHDTAGLMISIRGAIRLSGVELPATPALPSPCESCTERPCVSACPVGALNEKDIYDVPACKAHLRTKQGNACMQAGCLVRQICPVSRSFNRDPEQSAFHMRAFMGPES